MAELNIKATITRIAKFEKDTGVSLSDSINTNSVNLLVDLTRSLSGATDDQIDEFVKEEGIDALSDKILEAFVESGFLQKTQIEHLLGEEETNTETTQNSGKA